ncbi:putative transcriptional regulator [Rivularia sp. PCC 7116]|uniref:PadR family transcriptional regulator n=1 Tax=Rivularia sp. PCC 7116 TaxID=373994 RepID=UPI00029F3ACD|nr:PadR family transcriptional regulator [Rivularia sp. PCC 7116]AFY57104.1 putative transcriptional regulator [Rivularia sp. PCC 7116]
MALTQAILALLTKKSASGYELAKQFNADFVHLWKASQQQVYRELAKLEEQGLVSCEIVPRDAFLDKKLCSITDAGKKYLMEWINKPSQPAILREDLILKMLAGGLVEPRVLREELERHRRLHLDALAKFQGMEKNYLDNKKSLAAEKKLQYLAVRRGVCYEQDWLNWCDEALEAIEELEKI